MPRSGQMPAWASRPRISNSRWFTAGALVMRNPTESLSSTKPVFARTRPRSRCLAPKRPTSSQMVKITSMSPWRTPSSARASITSRMIAMPLLSSPPRTVRPSLRMMSPSTTGTTPSPGATVSMCAERSMGSAPAVSPSKWATRFPTSPPTAEPASSMNTVPPRDSRVSFRRAAMVPSRRDRLSIRTSSRTRSLRRILSIKEESLQKRICRLGRHECMQ